MRAFADCDVVGLDHAQIEIESDESVDAAFARYKPTVVINTAAFHNVEECERYPERAFAINAAAVDRLAEKAARSRAAFVTMSSDYVFSGSASKPYTERDEPSPLNVYGHSKRAGELYAQGHGPRWFVFRTSGMYGVRTSSQKGHTFVDRIIRQAQSGEIPRVVTDVYFSPSYAVDVARTIRQVIERDAFGLYHLTNAGGCSWFDFAAEALRLAGLKQEITPASYRDFNPTVDRPKYSILAHEALDRVGVSVPSWQDGLQRYVAARMAHSG